MKPPPHSPRSAPPAFLSVALLILISALGIGGLLFFWGRLLQPGNFGTLGLPLVAFIAGLAATFNPCALPALPAFLTLVAGGDSERSSYTRISLGAGLGAMALVLAVGILIAALGEGSKDFIRANFRWVQLGVGLFMVLLAVLHLLNRTSRLPVLNRLTDHGHRIWERIMTKSGPTDGFLFGGGFVLVGAG